MTTAANPFTPTASGTGSSSEIEASGNEVDGNKEESETASEESNESQPESPDSGSDNTNSEVGGTPLQEIEIGSQTDSSEPTEEPVSTPVEAASCNASDDVMQARTLQLINDARAQARNCGTDFFEATGQLSWNATLAQAAEGHSDDMAGNNFFSHTGSDGLGAADRAINAGYLWRTVGENIAAGRNTAAATVDDWLQSPGHCRNIMNPAFTEVAVVCVEDNASEYRHYWTNMLAAPR